MVSDASPDFCSPDLSDDRRTCQYNESGQKEDTEKCIKSVVNTNRMMLRWTSEHKQLVIDVLSKKWTWCSKAFIYSFISYIFTTLTRTSQVPMGVL
jgi:hypothetical protein